MRLRTKCGTLMVAAGMTGATAFGLGTTFTWGGNCDCYCWYNTDCWSWVGTPPSPYPNTTGDDVIFPAPALGTNPWTVLVDDDGSGLAGEIEFEWSVTFSEAPGGSDTITGTAIEISGTSEVVITVKDGLEIGSSS